MPFHKSVRDADGWRTIAEEIAFTNSHLEVSRVTVCSPTRPAPFTWTVAHRKAAVVVAPMTQTGSFVLVRQERVPIRATIWEFPAGQIDESCEPGSGSRFCLAALPSRAGLAYGVTQHVRPAPSGPR